VEDPPIVRVLQGSVPPSKLDDRRAVLDGRVRVVDDDGAGFLQGV
jgi:hypothetical protein